jgi:predicted permease
MKEEGAPAWFNLHPSSLIPHPSSFSSEELMPTLWQDLRHSARTLLKKPGFTLVAITTLALGVGANATIFNVVNGLLFKPLPIAEPEQVVSVYAMRADGTRAARFSWPDYQDYRERSEVFSGLIAHTLTPVTLGAGEQAEPLLCEQVSGNYFEMLGVAASPGRVFTSPEDQPSASRVAVLGYGFWQRRFGGDAAIAGQTLRLNGELFTVIGVAKREFRGTKLGPEIDVWVPLRQTGGWLRPDWETNRDRPLLQVQGRLKAGITMEQAQTAMSALSGQLSAAYPGANRTQNVQLVQASLLEGTRRSSVAAFFAIILALVGLVLLIACANVANLLLVRAVGRRREMAIRQALGAGRWRIVRQSLTESMMLSMLGGLAGLLISLWTGSLLLNFNPLPSFAIQFDLGIDNRALGFSLLISLLTGVVLGLVPALQTSRSELVAALKDEARSGAGSLHKSRLRSAFVMVQVALSLLLLIGAGLLLRSLQKTQAVELGFDPQNVFAMDFDLDLKGFSAERGQRFYQTMTEHIAALPGVTSASLANRAPLDISTPTTDAVIEGHTPPPGKAALSISSYRISPGYFQTMKIPLRAGREFTERDRAGAPEVVIINETMARRYWPNEEAIGKRFRLAAEGPPGMMAIADKQVEVIGVAKDSKYRTPGEDPTPHLYRPLLQDYDAGLTLLVRAAGDARQMMRVVRGELLLLDKDPQGFFARTMDEHMGVALAPARIAATLVGVFGLLALLLATVGLYGVISYSVSQRTQEIGVRLALGAQRSDIFKLIVGQGLKLTLIGVGIGLIVASALARLIGSLLFGVSATDPLTFALVALSLTGVALLACYLPARRATKVDPMVALRYE